MQEPAIGIDLGTTYSKVAYLDEKSRPRMVPNSEGNVLTPSAVFVNARGVEVGESAFTCAEERPESLVQLSKRLMGDLSIRLPIARPIYNPIEIASFIIQKLKRDTEQFLKTEVRRAVLSVPVGFGDLQREATAQAAQLAGIEVLELIEEPSAAALYYWIGGDEELGGLYGALGEHAYIMVFDLGGGTLDLALVNYERDTLRVVSASSDDRLGGSDWTSRVAEYLGIAIRGQTSVDPFSHPAQQQGLYSEAERVKRLLSEMATATARWPVSHTDLQLSLSRTTFEFLTRDLCKRVKGVTQDVRRAKSASAVFKDIHILLSGGASRMPMIQRVLVSLPGISERSLFPTKEPEEMVARGAAIQAGIVLRKKAQAGHSSRGADRLSRIEQIRIAPHALGVLAWSEDGKKLLNQVVISRNTTLPASGTCIVGTTQSDQRNVRIRIVEGDADDLDQLKHVGVCRIMDLPENLPVDSIIEVRLTYDTSCRLQIEATHLASGKKSTTELLRSVLATQLPGTESSRSLSLSAQEAAHRMTELSEQLRSEQRETAEVQKKLDHIEKESRSAASANVALERSLAMLRKQVEQLQQKLTESDAKIRHECQARIAAEQRADRERSSRESVERQVTEAQTELSRAREKLCKTEGLLDEERKRKQILDFQKLEQKHKETIEVCGGPQKLDSGLRYERMRKQRGDFFRHGEAFDGCSRKNALATGESPGQERPRRASARLSLVGLRPRRARLRFTGQRGR